MRKMIFAGLALGAALAPAAALADARDSVVAGMMRCAVLTDDRQWLDCYYGSAQPMRAELGLPAAPQAQIKLLATQPRSAAPLPSTLARAAVRTGPPPMPKRAGILNIWGGDDVVANTPVQSYDVTHDGFVITLPDGQVWAQTPDDANHHPVSWRDPASSMRVTISQAAMNTFNLVLNDENTHHKVHRVR
jgi:hypothetical protein